VIPTPRTTIKVYKDLEPAIIEAKNKLHSLTDQVAMLEGLTICVMEKICPHQICLLGN
jgi:hypothetical protein